MTSKMTETIQGEQPQLNELTTPNMVRAISTSSYLHSEPSTKRWKEFSIHNLAGCIQSPASSLTLKFIIQPHY